MKSTFDDKVYDILENVCTLDLGPDPYLDLDPSPNVEFDDVYPIGTIITTKKQTYLLTHGTLQLTYIYKTGSTSGITFFRTEFKIEHMFSNIRI